MIIDTDNVISVTEANQNFTKATKLADGHGCAIIYKRNKPTYVLVNIEDEKSCEELLKLIQKGKD